MTNIIKFSPQVAPGLENEFYTLRVYKDTENHGEVVASIEHNSTISPDVVSQHLNQLWWKQANTTSYDVNNRGKIVLQCNFFENTAEFVENPDIPKTKKHIEALKQEFENMIEALISEGQSRNEYED